MVREKRHVYMDLLRVMACFCVIYNHAKGYGFFMFASREPGSAQYFVELFASMLCKFAVPVFFALSGALMLDREIPLKTLWMKRIPRMALVLAVFSVVYYGVEIAAGTTPAGLRAFVFGAYESGWGYALWYLYAYLAYLVMLPVLSRAARALDNRTFLYLFALALVYRCLVPGFEAYYWEGLHKLNPDFDLSYLTGDLVLYPMLGYFLHHRVQKRSLSRVLPVLCAASVLLTCVSCMMTYRDYWKTWVTHTQTYHNLFAPVLCAAVFSAAKVFFGDMDAQSRAARVLSGISGCTFGVYLIHPLFVENLEGLGGLFAWMGGTGILPLAGSFLYCAVMMLICLVPVWLLRKVPVIGKLIS